MLNRVVKPRARRSRWLTAGLVVFAAGMLLVAALTFGPTLAGSDLPRKALEHLSSNGGPLPEDEGIHQEDRVEANLRSRPEFPDPEATVRPLAVRSDEALVALARDYGHVGAGTRSDPVVLEGDALKETALDRLVVENTNLTLQVNDLQLKGDSKGVAIVLSETANVTLRGIRVEGYHTGVEADRSAGMQIHDSTFRENSRAVLLVGFDRAEIRDNRFLENGHAVFVRTPMDPEGDPSQTWPTHGLAFTGNTVERTPVTGSEPDRIDHEASALVLSGSGIRVLKNNFTGHSPSAVRVNATDVLIQGNGFLDGKEYGVIVAHSENVELSDNRFVRNVKSAVHSLGTEGLMVTGNVFERNPNGAIKSVRDSAVIIEGNELSWSGSGVTMWSPQNLVFSQNVVSGGNNGLRVMDGVDVSVLENRFEGNWESSVVYFRVKGSQIDDNVFRDGRSSGVYLVEVENVQLKDNLVERNHHGFVVTGGSRGVDVVRNDLSKKGNVGIRVNEAENILLKDNRATAIDFAVLVEDEAKGVVARGGYLSQNHAGITIVDAEHPVLLEDVQVHGNWVGVSVEDTNGHRLSGLQVTENDRGVFLRRTQENTITGSHLQDNGLGLYLVKATGNLVFDNAFDNTQKPGSMNALLYSSPDNQWNVSMTNGPNIIGGRMIAGNWWNDYLGVDANMDGLGDVPHQPIPYHPLLELPAYELGLPMGPFDLHPLVKDSGPPV